MKKIFGIEAEFNITADEDIVKGIGAGIKNGSVAVGDIVKEVAPVVAESVKKYLEKKCEELTPASAGKERGDGKPQHREKFRGDHFSDIEKRA